jgi:gamma-polyglutamate biosynthesis protein CapA
MSKFDKASLALKWLTVSAVGLTAILTVVLLLLKTGENNSFSRDREQPKALPVTRLFFGGDIMLSRNVGQKIFESGNYDLPFLNIGDRIRQAQISMANLESPLSDKGARVTQGLVFKAEPETIQGLKDAGWTALGTTNNHTFDQGKYGLNYTLEALKQNGIEPVGTGTNCHDGVVIEKNNIRFGFLAYSYSGFNDGGKRSDPLVCDTKNLDILSSDIELLKTKADFVVVSMHMGVEYAREPNAAQKEFAHTAVDAGADLVVGHHPHWIQTIEQYQGKWIFYSLGNLVFDQMWSQDTKEGLTVEVTIKQNQIDKIELLPVVIENYCCPRWATSAETKTILQKINPQTQSNILIRDGQISPDWTAKKEREN